MNNTFKKNSIALAISMSFAGASNAGLITIDDNFADPTLLTQGVHNGSFNILSSLFPAEDYNAPYQITSAAIMFSFSDDAADSSNSYSTTRTGSVHNKYRDVTYYDRVNTVTNEHESIELGIAGAEFEEETGYYDTGAVYQNTNNNTSSHYHNSSWGGGYYHTVGSVYNNYLQNRGYTGDFVVAELLDLNSLNDLLTTGILGFDLGVTGDIFLNRAELVIDIQSNPVNVAEPASLGLLSLSLAGLFGSRRLQKKSS